LRKAEDAVVKVIDSLRFARVPTFQQERIARPLARIRARSHCGAIQLLSVRSRQCKIKGRPDDFEQVMLPHLDAAYNLARWLVRDSSIAEDVVQDAYERACKYYSSFHGGSGRAVAAADSSQCRLRDT
jgi:hypothetical protein